MELAPGILPPALALAEVLINSRQYGKAMHLLAQVSERAPNALAPHLLLLRLLVEVGESQAALQPGEALRRAAPDHPEVAALWAEAMTQAGRDDEAEEQLNPCCSRPPARRGRSSSVSSRSDLSLEPPRFSRAVERMEAAIGASASPAELRLELAQLQLGLDHQRDAAKSLTYFADDEQAEIGTLLSGALVARNHGLWGEARKLGEAARQRVQGTPAEPQIAAFIEGLPEG